MVGGAINAVSQSLEKADQRVHSDRNSNEGESRKGINLFGNDGRPPFVMNTAVDENEEEEEEELVWDDDDDTDEDNSDSESQENNTPLKKTFSGGSNTEIISEQLETAINERDVLQETVELQRKEIVKLREQMSNQEKVNIALSEKDAELKLLKASMEGKVEDGMLRQIEEDAIKISTLERTNEDITSKLSSKDDKVASLQNQVVMLENDIVKMREEAISKEEQSSIENTEADGKCLSSEKDADELLAAREEASIAKSKVESLTKELHELKTELTSAKSQYKTLEKESSELKETKRQVEALKLEVQELASKKNDADNLQKELQSLQEQMKHTPSHANSPNSESTGVKIDARSSSSTGANDDGWGDEDW